MGGGRMLAVVRAGIRIKMIKMKMIQMIKRNIGYIVRRGK